MLSRAYLNCSYCAAQFERIGKIWASVCERDAVGLEQYGMQLACMRIASA
jgi:hypothetical protein